jgi:hypothetical protein
MNERLRELVRQAGLDDADFPIENWDNIPLSKFAQLIIEECMGHVTWVGRMNQWPIEPFLTALTINKRIKEQLGTS